MMIIFALDFFIAANRLKNNAEIVRKSDYHLGDVVTKAALFTWCFYLLITQ
jgi:hypothetical protein